ncbi:glycosyltransferase [Dyadobacter psychrotolerans]|uniref:Glycosyltransferase n=1 Tax=Dyadobacter psychrotolerans TaxID=2541721 RepID=A0A4R5DC33_9BACT|nr:glycosyltransferase [Dyadobacter psychrotolerans]TDE11276.1 glycosyltransferase [Dyadobacter psychrotolerans]
MIADLAVDRILFDKIKPSASTKVCVIVPVRNEAECLWETLEALRLQEDNSGNRLPSDVYEVLVLVNNTTDNSFEIAEKYAALYPSFRLAAEEIWQEGDRANIGTVRRLLMDDAYRRLMLTGNQNGIIASTDGDTTVDSRWICNIIAEIEKGNDAVGGRILTEKEGGTSRLYHLRDVTYRCLLAQAESLIDPRQHNPFPCHFQYFGANMAVTCSMYNQAGRLPQVPFLEDMAFHKALMLQDARIRRSFEVKVYTSSRVDGRVSIGFSEQLRRWMNEDEARIPQMVEDVTPVLLMFEIRAQLRQCWNDYVEKRIVRRDELSSIAAKLNIKVEWLHSQLISSTYFGGLWDVINLLVGNREPELQPIHEAIDQLRLFIKSRKTNAFQTSPSDMFVRAGRASA